MKKSIFDLEFRKEFFENNSIKSFRIKQIEYEIFHNSVIDFNAMTTLSLDLRELFSQNFFILPFEVD